MPLHQDVEQGHRETEPGLEVGPHPMHHLLEMADRREHRQYCLNEHPLIPFTPLAQAQVVWMPVGFVKALVGKDHHLLSSLLYHLLEGAAVMDVGGITAPVHDQAQVIEQEAELAAHDPASIGEAFLADLLLAAPFSAGMDQLDSIAVDDAEQRRCCHEGCGQVPMAVEQTEQASALRQLWKQRPVISFKPTIEGAIADAFEGKEQRQGDDFAGIQIPLTVLVVMAQFDEALVYLEKQLCDKIRGGHEGVLSVSCEFAPEIA